MKTKKFSFDTIENFDDHINLSIPNYEGLINHILNISTYYIKNDSTFYDFGCSTGNLINKLKEKHKTNTNYIGVDKSENMTKENDFIIKADLKDFKVEKHNFSVFIFTLQFMSLENRKRILKEVYNNLEEDGSVIIAEKTFLKDGFLQDLFNFSYYDFKLKNFDAKDILNKQVDLRYIMRPLTEKQNKKMFKETGFKYIQAFWQSLQFKAWILTKQ